MQLAVPPGREGPSGGAQQLAPLRSHVETARITIGGPLAQPNTGRLSENEPAEPAGAVETAPAV